MKTSFWATVTIVILDGTSLSQNSVREYFWCHWIILTLWANVLGQTLTNTASGFSKCYHFYVNCQQQVRWIISFGHLVAYSNCHQNYTWIHVKRLQYPNFIKITMDYISANCHHRRGTGPAVPIQKIRSKYILGFIPGLCQRRQNQTTGECPNKTQLNIYPLHESWCGTDHLKYDSTYI